MKTKQIYLFVLIASLFAACEDPYEQFRPYDPSNPNNSATMPNAKFSYETKQPLSVVFENLSQNASFYEWSFGDGTTSTEDNPKHRYKTKGVYKVTLTAWNGNVSRETSATITIENPNRIYIYGFGIEKIPYENQYYYIKVVDDDFFTTTWVNTEYILLSSAILPHQYKLTSPVLLDGLHEDDYYVMQLYYNTKKTGTGTKVAGFTMKTSQILQYPEKLTGTGDNVSVTTYFSYK